jgi:Mrp family chromosome partitioning ATPase
VGADATVGSVPVVFGASRVGLPASDIEAYQALGSEVFLALPDASSKIVMLASAEPGGGTTTVAREFASTLALNGEVKTLLIDANLRKPVLHDAFGIRRTPGISDHVLADAALADCLRDPGVPNLTLLPAGRPAVAPPRILADPRIDGMPVCRRRSALAEGRRSRAGHPVGRDEAGSGTASSRSIGRCRR